MAPTLATTPYFSASSTNGDTTTLATPSFTPADGEVFVIKVSTWDTAVASGTPSGGSLTYTSRVTIAPGGFSSYARIFTAEVGTSPGSMTITLSAPASASYHTMCVERWTSAQLAGTPATNSASYGSPGAPSSSLTTAAAGSIVSWVAVDAQSVSPTGRAYLASATEDGFGDGSGQGSSVVYAAYQAAASAGAQIYGMSAPTGQKWVMAAIEVQAAAGGGGSAPVPQPLIVPRLAALQRAVW